jgi:hypothetical protein
MLESALWGLSEIKRRHNIHLMSFRGTQTVHCTFLQKLQFSHIDALVELCVLRDVKMQMKTIYKRKMAENVTDEAACEFELKFLSLC